jgi:hypothetical protein
MFDDFDVPVINPNIPQRRGDTEDNKQKKMAFLRALCA